VRRKSSKRFVFDREWKEEGSATTSDDDDRRRRVLSFVLCRSLQSHPGACSWSFSAAVREQRSSTRAWD